MEIVHSDNNKLNRYKALKDAEEMSHRMYKAPNSHLDDDVKTEHQRTIDSLWDSARDAFMAGVKYRLDQEEVENK